MAAAPISKGKYESPAAKGLTPGEYYVIFTIEEPSGETENNKAVPTEPQEPAKKSRPKL